MPEQPAAFAYSLQTDSDGLRVYASGVTEVNHADVVEAVERVLYSADTNRPSITASAAVDDLLADGARETTGEGLDPIREAILSVVERDARLHSASDAQGIDGATAGDPDAMLTAEETAQVLRQHPETILTWLREGRLPGSKRGRWLVRRGDLLEWIAQGKSVDAAVGSQPVIEQQTEPVSPSRQPPRGRPSF